MNSPNRLQQTEDLFHAALEREPAERAAFIAEACADDPPLLDAVNDLLAAHDQSWSLVDQRHAAIETDNTSDPTRRMPKPPEPQSENCLRLPTFSRLRQSPSPSSRQSPLIRQICH